MGMRFIHMDAIMNTICVVCQVFCVDWSPLQAAVQLLSLMVLA